MGGGSRIEVHRLSPSAAGFTSEASKFATLRLRALKESASAFSSSHDIESRFTSDDWESRLSRPTVHTFVAVDLPDEEATDNAWEQADWVGKAILLGPVNKETFELADVQGLASADASAESRWQMNSLYVDSRVRGRGVAKHLIAAVTAFARAYAHDGPPAESTRIRIMIKPENHRVRQLYIGTGFEDVGKCTLGEALRANGDGALIPGYEANTAKYTTKGGLVMEFVSSSKNEKIH